MVFGLVPAGVSELCTRLNSGWKSAVFVLGHHANKGCQPEFPLTDLTDSSQGLGFDTVLSDLNTHSSQPMK